MEKENIDHDQDAPYKTQLYDRIRQAAKEAQKMRCLLDSAGSSIQS
jgi:hypothetical protein